MPHASQVKLFLHWVAYLSSIGFSTLDALWLNMDETPLRFYPKPQRGNAYEHHEGCRDVSGYVSLRDLRTQVTLAVAVASDAAAQKQLSQVLLPNDLGRKKVRDQLTADLKTIWKNIHVIRRSGGWMSCDGMTSYLDVMRKAATAAGYKKVVLLMDAARPHLSPATLRRIQSKGWKVILISG